MTTLDPFVVPPPPKWVSDPEIEPFIRYTIQFLHDLRIRTGGGTDEIASLVNSVLESFSPGNAGKIFTPRIQSTDYTAVDGDFIEARNGITVKFEGAPNFNDQIIVCNGDGKPIKIDGNGVQLRYKNKRTDKLILSNEGTSLHWYLFANEQEMYWRAS